MWPLVVHVLSVPKANYSGPFTACGPRSCFIEGDAEYFRGICTTLCPRGLAHPLGPASAQNKESRIKRGTDPALKNIFILYYEGFSICILCTAYVTGVCRAQKRASDPLEVELLMVSCHVGAAFKFGPSLSAPNC